MMSGVAASAGVENVNSRGSNDDSEDEDKDVVEVNLRRKVEGGWLNAMVAITGRRDRRLRIDGEAKVCAFGEVIRTRQLLRFVS